MKLLIRRLHAEWPSWAAVSFIALLPFHRLAEIPLSLFALALPFLLAREQYRPSLRKAAQFLVPLFLCYWVPMVLSSLDSMATRISWLHCLGDLRYLAATLSMAALLHSSSARWRVLRWTSFLLLFWAADGFVQLLFGRDVFGIAMHADRLNALFKEKYQGVKIIPFTEFPIVYVGGDAESQKKIAKENFLCCEKRKFGKRRDI